MDEGPPTSYLLLAKDTPVYCCDEISAGTVKQFSANPKTTSSTA
jgi:hypothetical protein